MVHNHIYRLIVQLDCKIFILFRFTDEAHRFGRGKRKKRYKSMESHTSEMKYMKFKIFSSQNDSIINCT